MDSFSDNIAEFLEANPDAGIDELKKEMGTPQEIADGFLENASSKTIKRKTSFASWVKGALVVIILIYVIAIVITLVDSHHDTNGYIVEKTGEVKVIVEKD